MHEMRFHKFITNITLFIGLCLFQAGCFNSSFQPSLTTPIPTNDGTSVIEISEGNIADGITPTELSVWIKSAAGIPAEGVLPTISTSATNIVVVPCNVTDSNGLSRCKVYSTSAGKKSFTITSPFSSITLEIDFLRPKALHGSFAVVSGSTYQSVPAGNKVISASGIVESNINQKDNAGIDRLHSSHLSTIINE
ncbi:Ig-like domain-containing protein [Bdellovibrio sp. HCB209]|uniref:Ig-like domain-containing protein n=1 Tax=Bdellovibrio sp. HCB209 TaxID=3394354 RepID=UPI0039B3B9E6